MTREGGSTRRWRNQRSRTLTRDRWTCIQCGSPATEVDHILGRAEGGTDILDNLRSLCTPCHAAHTREQTRRGAARRAVRGRYNPGTHPGLL